VADKWKASIKTMGGRAVALVDVEIHRTIYVDMELWEKFSRELTATSDARGGVDGELIGLSGVGTLYGDAQDIPEKSRSYVAIPWTEADSSKIGLRKLSTILDWLEGKSYWRIEGDAKSGFTGYLNFGGMDYKYDLSWGNIDNVDALMDTQLAASQAQLDNGLLTPDQKNLFDNTCNDIKGDIKWCKERKLEQDRLEKQQREQREKLQREQEQKERDKEAEPKQIGDFGKDFGHEMGGVC
jgi:hypothetical protein